MLSICALLSTAFVVPPPLAASALSARQAAVSVRMTDIPRIELPSVITDVLKDQNLKNPNEMDSTAYNNYSAAAIGATLIFFILPIFDIAGFFGDFILSALIGGGAGAYASLRKDAVGEYGDKFGGIVMQGGVPRLPRALEHRGRRGALSGVGTVPFLWAS